MHVYNLFPFSTETDQSIYTRHEMLYSWDMGVCLETCFLRSDVGPCMRQGLVTRIRQIGMMMTSVMSCRQVGQYQW